MRRPIEEDFLSDINVTPFVDVLLVLVVILLVTLPYMNTANLQINLPKVALKNDATPKLAPQVITINSAGEYWFENHKSDKQSILKALLDKKAKDLVGVVIIQSDKDLAYGKVVELIAILKNNGFDRIGLTIEKPNA